MIMKFFQEKQKNFYIEKKINFTEKDHFFYKYVLPYEHIWQIQYTQNNKKRKEK